MDGDTAIKIENLSKSFEDILVIKDSNMNVTKGSVYGFLGANGSGKTTIFKIITGLLSPTGGMVEVLGMDVKKDSERILGGIGSLIEAPTFYEHLSVGLSEVGKKPVGKFSLGMRQRLGIARALVHKPQIKEQYHESLENYFFNIMSGVNTSC